MCYGGSAGERGGGVRTYNRHAQVSIHRCAAVWWRDEAAQYSHEGGSTFSVLGRCMTAAACPCGDLSKHLLRYSGGGSPGQAPQIYYPGCRDMQRGPRALHAMLRATGCAHFGFAPC
jgi:hypothetical protein